MVSLLVIMLVLLVISGVFLIKPLMAEEAGEVASGSAEASMSVADLSPEQRQEAIEELMWRIDHDLATGRIDAEEHELLKARAEQARHGGGSKRKS
jgi:hypothetical protein